MQVVVTMREQTTKISACPATNKQIQPTNKQWSPTETSQCEPCLYLQIHHSCIVNPAQLHNYIKALKDFLLSLCVGGSWALELVVYFDWLLICVTVLIYGISSLGSIIRMLQPKVLFPSTIYVSSLKTVENSVSIRKVLWTTQ